MPLTSRVHISRRFRGPPGSANGGYVAGLVAGGLTPAAEVTLRAPPPLDRDLELHVLPGDERELRDGETLLATARPSELARPDFNAPGLEAATAAATRSFPAAAHPVPGCFVCGPARPAGDGLRIHVGPIDTGDTAWDGVLASPWTAPREFADDDGRVRPEFVWAALDCPSAYACSSSGGMPPILLGRQAVRVWSLPRADEPLVIAARQLGREGRKHFAESALASAAGEWLAVCRATWIEVSAEVLNANAGRGGQGQNA